MDPLYPMNLSLVNKAVLVVGGGAVGERKVRGLLTCKAQVTLVSLTITDGLAQLVADGALTWLQKGYAHTDLDDRDLVFVATDNAELNRQIYEDATKRHLMINVADSPELCTFYLPSVLRRGSLTITVSTEGASPLLAQRIRGQLEQLFAENYGNYVAFLGSHRVQVQQSINATQRKAFWEAVLDDDALLDSCLAGNTDRAEEIMSALITRFVSGEVLR